MIGGRGYWAHPQVLDLLAYLRALANPRDEEPLYGVLASPLVGASLDALVLVAAAARGAGVDPWRALSDPAIALEGLSERDRLALERFVGWFSAQRARRARASIEELIEVALEQTGYDLAMLAMPGGPRRLANVRKLMRLGREHEAAHGPDLRGFLALVDDRESGAEAPREGEAPVEGEGLNAIRLMTIHRAKGLEFPIVCVVDLGRTPRPPSTILRVAPGETGSASGRIGLRLARAGTGSRENALEYGPIGKELLAADEAEEKRLFYVAMTRARERLLLSGAARLENWREGKFTKGGPVAWIAPALVPDLAQLLGAGGGEVVHGRGLLRLTLPQPGDEIGEGVAVEVAAGQPADGLPVPSADTVVATLETLAPAAPAGAPVSRLSYSALTEYARCGYRFYAERVLGLPAGAAGDDEADVPQGVTAPPTPRAYRSAADRGVLAHALLERLDFRPGGRDRLPATDVARAAAARAAMFPPPGPEELDELVAVVRRFSASALCDRLGRATDVRREQQFAFGLTADPADPLVVGVLDVIAREIGPDGPTSLVVDYKTDRLDGATPETIVTRDYAGQRLIYALAALHAGAPRVEVLHCFLQAPDTPATAVFTREDLPRLQQQLIARAAGVRERRFAVAPDPHRSLCAGCPAEGGLCSWPLSMTRRESADTLF